MKIFIFLILTINGSITNRKYHKSWKTLDETSGLEMINNELLTFNDSGGEPALYYLNKKEKLRIQEN